MTKFVFELSVSCSPTPGCDWDAWIGFKPLVKGFSILARYSDGGGRSIRIGRSKKALSWKTACETLLRIDDAWLLGDNFLQQTHVRGTEGWRADLLASCWFGGEYAFRREIAFLCAQDEGTLNALHSGFKHGLAGKECLEVISNVMDIFDDNPNLRQVCGGEVTVPALIEAIRRSEADSEKEAQEHAESVRKALLPFDVKIQAIVARLTSAWTHPSGYASGLGFSFRKNALTNALRKFALENQRMPDTLEIHEIEQTVKSIRSF